MLQLLSYSHFFSRFCISWKSHAHNYVCIQYRKYSHFLQHIFWGMSSFKYFGKKPGSDTGNEKYYHPSPAYLPSAFESGLDRSSTKMSYQMLSTLRTLEQLAPSTGRQRGKRQFYAHYSGEMRAKIGTYAAENGNKKARKHFSKDFPVLKESTIRNFKKKFYVKLAEERKAGNTQVICIPSEVHGRPPILMDLDNKLVTFLKGIRSRAGVINIHVAGASCYTCTYHK